MTNSAALPRSERIQRFFEVVLVVLLLSALIAAAAAWFFSRGYLLYYGDATAHLNISRGIIDSKTPGYDQLGTVWLPLLHVLCLPWIGNDWLWSTGLAGTIPVAICFVVAGAFFFLAACEAYGSSAAAAVVVGCFALNPNILYLASIPMTEIVFLAGLSILVFAALRFRNTQHAIWLAPGIVASWLMSLTRYDGWFLIPFSALWFAINSHWHKLRVLVLFGALASLAPAYWMAHNWWETSNPLDFYNGPYSAAAIQGTASYPGYHDWNVALQYYSLAAELCAGVTLLVIGGLGIICAATKRSLFPILFLCLTPAFYVWSIHSSKTPVRVPQFWHSYYNTRYGIAVVALTAFAAGAVVLVVPRRFSRFWFVLPLIAVVPWLIPPSEENWICWKESQVNSVSRRFWTNAAARYLQTRYQAGQGILASSGDVTGIFCRGRIHLSETINIGNGPLWFAATSRPDLLHPTLWTVTQKGDLADKALERAPSSPYRIVEEIRSREDPVLKICQRVNQ